MGKKSRRISGVIGQMTAVIGLGFLGGSFLSPSPISAREEPECGWECKGLKCKQDDNYPDITCKEELGPTCTNFACDDN